MGAKLKIEKQYDRIFRFCYMKTRDKHIAEDITQETFLRFLNNHNVSEIDKNMPYLYAISRNLCTDYYRQRKPIELDENTPIQEDKETKLIDEALEKIGEEEKELLLLRYVNNTPINDLAKQYGVSRFAISRKIKKALKHLKEVYENG